MSYKLVIVESPAKCSKIEKYLGPGYKCIASFGHLQQLSSLKDINIEDDFKLNFNIIPSKSQQIDKIKKMISYSSEVILATDDDREGEGIAWHICKLFNLNVLTTKRIIFHEVTENALKQAIQNITTLNLNLVNAQQSRQILDLLVGYIISPKLWEHISRTQKGLSAGRCQTPALRLVYENQLEIEKSPGKKVYNITGYFTSNNYPFILNFSYDKEDDVKLFLENSINFQHILSIDSIKESVRKAPNPFTTSSLQQAANNELHISPKETMSICQKLYENGYITYMRTDSKIYSKDFVNTTLKYIENKYGEKYIISNIDKITISSNLLHSSTKKETKKESKKDTKKDSKKDTKKETNNAQEAHEAIRPTNIKVEKLSEDFDFSNKEKKMYLLIWKNTIQSCMADAIYNICLNKISAPDKKDYRYTSEQIIFEGWKIVENKNLQDSKAFEAFNYLPKLKSPNVNYNKILAKLSLKDLKSHYTESKLVQLLEEKGIGRPSTFSSLIEKIQERGYVKKENIKGKKIECLDFELNKKEIKEIKELKEFGNENNKLVIQDIGKLVIEFLIKNYNSLFEYEYTSNMEEQLDLIAKGNLNYIDLCQKTLNDINKEAEKLQNSKKCIFKFDENNTFLIGAYGPVIRTNDNKFLSVKKDIDIDKLKNGEYKLEEILESSNLNKLLGRYENSEIYLKKGKFGLYVQWGENKKSLNNLNFNECSIDLNDVITYLNTNKDLKNPNIIRILSSDLSIRNGKYGDYIFHQTPDMKKPNFYKLYGFKDDYKNCLEEIIINWINEKYNL